MNATLTAVLDTSGARATLRDPASVRDRIDGVVRLAVFGGETERGLARYAIHAAAPQLGVVSSSIAGLYAARGRGEAGGFTVPAVNVRGMSYDMSRSLFRAMRATNAAAVVFEQARSELAYTQQDQAELAAVVLGAAIAERYEGPVFLQGDHYQANAKRFAAEPESETRALEDLVRKAVAAQFYNIDIDASTLVDLSFERVADQQSPNARLTAHLATLVRSLQPAGVRISIGGEIGEVGKHNTTVEELCCYVDAVRDLAGPGFESISKVSVQTGTTHGGIPLPDGTIARVALDFDTLREISRVCRETYGMAGAVQHGASTLPDELFHRFPEAETAEVHLATGFTNLLLDHPAFPAPLLDEMRAYSNRAFASERVDGETDAQFFYKTRKQLWGPFKRQTWDLPDGVRAELNSALQSKFEFLIRQLRANDTREMTLRHVVQKAVEVEPPLVGSLA
ncbi:MAG TPA: class II fructose-bisphosphate aldolase [Dehalococcoidia bacterium]|nr:class II fructose-bisphosphate aldolase [Dehalococcoidia bacterium]